MVGSKGWLRWRASARVLVAAVAALCLVAGGCGNDDKDDKKPEPTPEQLDG